MIAVVGDVCVQFSDARMCPITAYRGINVA